MKTNSDKQINKPKTVSLGGPSPGVLQILAPENKDIVAQNFAVDGTYTSLPATVHVTAGGKSADAPVNSNQTWTANLVDVPIADDTTVTATVGGSSASVIVNVVLDGAGGGTFFE